MRRVSLCLLLSLLLFAGGSAGLDHSPSANKVSAKSGEKPATSSNSKETSAQPIAFEAVMGDRSVVRIGLLDAHVRIATHYGSLEVPAAQIQSIEFTHRPVPDAPKRVAAAIEKLKSDDFDVRQAGTKELVALGPASYHPLVEACGSTDLEVKKRAQGVIVTLEKQYAREELQRKPYDLIQTPTFTIAGLIQPATLNVRTAYFGEARVKLGDVRSFRAMGEGRDATLAWTPPATPAQADATGWKRASRCGPGRGCPSRRRGRSTCILRTGTPASTRPRPRAPNGPAAAAARAVARRWRPPAWSSGGSARAAGNSSSAKSTRVPQARWARCTCASSPARGATPPSASTR
jgi:hypothetical protein